MVVGFISASGHEDQCRHIFDEMFEDMIDEAMAERTVMLQPHQVALYGLDGDVTVMDLAKPGQALTAVPQYIDVPIAHSVSFMADPVVSFDGPQVARYLHQGGHGSRVYVRSRS